MKLNKSFRAATVIAALLLQSAAIDAASVQSRKTTTRKKANPTGPAVKASPESVVETTPVTSPTPAPVKANNREATREQTPAPAAPLSVAATETTAKKANEALAGRYFYEFKQPEFIVRRILIEHDAAGHGQMSFARKDSEEVFTDPLDISPAALARIMAAWEALKFLETEANYQADKQFPHLGTMTLGLKQGTRERKAEFNWTHDEQAAALVKEYKRIGEQQLFIFDMTVARQYQPSDTIKIFKRLESLLNRDELSDTAQLVPLLHDLTTDERIPLIARNHATRLLKKIEK